MTEEQAKQAGIILSTISDIDRMLDDLKHPYTTIIFKPGLKRCLVSSGKVPHYWQGGIKVEMCKFLNGKREEYSTELKNIK